MSRIGIMQGRLVPPIDNRIQHFPRMNWKDEFDLAAKANLDCIEWIYDMYGIDVNPLASDSGIKEIKSVISISGVQVLSLCADYFMDNPFVRVNMLELQDRMETLTWLMQRGQLLGINRIVLPFVDSSHIDTDIEMDSICKILEKVLLTSEKTSVEIHLETDLTPERFAKLLNRLSHPMLKVNYDIGNSSSLGYIPDEEFSAYGIYIGSVHIKDRLLGGSTVALGTGNADFPSIFDCLKRVRYSGDLILQVARGVSGEELTWAQNNRVFTLNYLQERL
jgi:L-ribulose-5-phosphate 3-epimerase